MYYAAKKLIVRNNAPLKATALIAGTTFWYLFSMHSMVTEQITVPLCFYQVPEMLAIHGPENITLTVRGSRRALRSINKQNMACHVSADSMTVGNNPIRIDNTQLFLPETIKLVHYTNAPIVIRAAHRNR